MGKIKKKAVKSVTKERHAGSVTKKIEWPSDLEYISFFNSCVIAPEHLGEIDKIIDERIVANRIRYECVALSASRKISILDKMPFEWSSTFGSEPRSSNALVFYVPTLLRDVHVSFPSVGGQYDDRIMLGRDDVGLRLGNGEPTLSADRGDFSNWLSNDFRFRPSGGRYVPWYVIGVIHNMEGNCNFKVHLHNGDPLTGFTTHFPPGHPKVGHPPPFTWEESAIDALTIVRHFDDVPHWNLPVILRSIESYNGTSYMHMRRYSPYLWSYSNLFTKGKYVRDKVFDPNAGSKQAGAAVVLKRMEERGIIYMSRW